MKEDLDCSRDHVMGWGEGWYWCGGWDSNPRRPSPQGPKPTAGSVHAFCPLDLALVPPRCGPETRAEPGANKNYFKTRLHRIHIIDESGQTLAFPSPKLRQYSLKTRHTRLPGGGA